MTTFFLPKIKSIPSLEFTTANIHFTDNPIISHSLFYYVNEIKQQWHELFLTNVALKEEDLLKKLYPYEYLNTKIPSLNQQISLWKQTSHVFYELWELFQTTIILEHWRESKSMTTLCYGLTHSICLEVLLKCRPTLFKRDFHTIVSSFEPPTSTLLDSIDFLFYDLPNELNDTLIDFMIHCLTYQKMGGSMVFKVDLLSLGMHPMLIILYFQCFIYEKVCVVRPTTSHFMSTYHYIVCKHFSISNEQRIQILQYFYQLKKKIFYPIFIPHLMFLNKIEDMNIVMGQQWIQSLESIVSLLKNKHNDIKIEQIMQQNMQKSILWCEKYKVPISSSLFHPNANN